MPAKRIASYPELSQLIKDALMSNDAHPLVTYLVERSNLPGPRMNTALVAEFADQIGQVVPSTTTLTTVERLLNEWASLPLSAAPINDPREMLPAAAILAYAEFALKQPALWSEQVGKLHTAASNPRWRCRETVATALQRLLKANWSRTYQTLTEWLTDTDPLVLRAAAAGIAEPPLLNNESRGTEALSIQIRVVDWLLQQPENRRREEGIRTLRQALGFTVSVAVAAAPQPGFEWLNRLAVSPDPYVRQSVAENLKKNRLKAWPEQLAEVEKLLGS